MGRVKIILDPDGYQYASEPGIMWTVNGRDLDEKFRPDPAKPALADTKLFNPPGSDWLLARPRQWSPTWYQDSRLERHVIPDAYWTFAGGVTHREYEFTRLPAGAQYTANLWVQAFVPASFTSLDSCDYTALGTAAGITFPAGFGTVAFADQFTAGSVPTPADTRLVGSITPYLQWVTYPEPFDVLVFGFSDLALILDGKDVYVLQSPDNDKQTWKLLTRGANKAQRVERASSGGGSITSAASAAAEIRSLLAMLVGFEHLYLFDGNLDNVIAPKIRAIDPETGLSPLPADGSYWFGAAPRQAFGFQCQIVGYEEADSRAINAAAPAKHFDLGPYYKPSVDPELAQHSAITYQTGDDPPDVSPVTNGAVTILHTESGQALEFGLLDEDGDAWESDGTHQAGSVYVAITPGDQLTPFWGYLCPQLHIIDIKFPVVLTNRVNDPLTLDDTQWRDWEAETSYDDPYGKRIQVSLWDAGAKRLIDAGFDRRGSFPIHIVETIGITDHVRVAGWVRELELALDRMTDPDTGEAIQVYTFQAAGLLSRLEDDWQYLPQICDPDGDGYIEHTYAVAEVLKQRGFDTSNSAVYVARTDPWAGTDVARLPGTWARQPGQIGQRIESPYAPDWDKSPREYLRMIEEFRGWRLYEALDGLIRYHDDFRLQAQLAAPYYAPDTLYWSKATAAAAGRAGQYVMADPVRHIDEPEANVIRVTGKGYEGLILPQYLERDVISIEGPSTDPDFVGEPRVLGIVTKLAVDEQSMAQVCRVALKSRKRRKVAWSVSIPLAPWRFGSVALAAGDCLALDGDHFGGQLVVHLQVRQIKSHATIGSDYLESRVTLERLPAESAAGGSAGDYPGAAAIT